MSSPQTIAALHARLRAIAPAPPGLALGLPALAAALPRGLPLAALHEVAAAGLAAELGALPAAFVACLLARLPDPRPVFWIAPGTPDLNPAGLLPYGFDPARLLLVATENDAGPRGTLPAMEAALRGGAAAAVVAEVARVPKLAARRLHLACAAHATTGFLLRRWPHGRAVGRDDADAAPVATRWRIGPAPSRPQGGPGIAREPGPPRWAVELLHAREGAPGAWLMELADDPHAAFPLRLVAGLADAAPAPRRRLRAG